MALLQAAAEFVVTLFRILSADMAFRKLREPKPHPPVAVQVLAFVLLLLALAAIIFASVSLITFLITKLGHA